MDWNKVGTLLHVLETARQLPHLDEINRQAMAELVAINNEEKRTEKAPKIITPAGGPPNSVLEHPDGTKEQIPQRAPMDDVGRKANLPNPIPNNDPTKPVRHEQSKVHEPELGQRHAPIYPPDANRPQTPTNPREPFHPANPDTDVERRV